MTPHYDLKQQEKKKTTVFWGLGWGGGSQTFLSYIAGGGGGGRVFLSNGIGGVVKIFAYPHENVTGPTT